jgi:glutathione peroxidase
MAIGKWKQRTTGVLSKKVEPLISFYDLKATLNNGESFDFAELRGKKVLIVNTASDCGFTNQYGDLEKLFEEMNKELMILAFPANDFKQQEKKDDKRIAEFCELNYGIKFPLMKKSSVKKTNEQHNVFRWLSDSKQNGWNGKSPAWNFSKYLVNEKGWLTHYFGPAISPMGKEIKKAIMDGD